MRCFFGIPLPPEARMAIRMAWDGARADLSGKGARWVPDENLHLTLRYLGETDRGRLNSVTRDAGSVIEGWAAPGLELGQPGVFPGRGSKPLVLWLGLQGDLLSLEALARRLELCAREAGFRPENRSFRPHVTLARLKGEPALNLQNHILPSVEPVAWTPGEVHLFQSVPGPRGVEYPTLQSWAFSRSASAPTLPE